MRSRNLIQPLFAIYLNVLRLSHRTPSKALAMDFEVLVLIRPHHPRRQKTLSVQPAAAAAAAAAVGMTLNDVLRGTYHARADRLQEVGGRAVRPSRPGRPRRVVLGLDSMELLFSINSVELQQTLLARCMAHM